MEYTLIKSKRKTLSAELDHHGNLIVRAPQRATKKDVDRFLQKHQQWIETKQQEFQNHPPEPPLTEEELTYLKKRAKDYIPARVAYYAPLIGVTPNRITIRVQKTRWGSCTKDQNLNFNALLMLCPLDVIDSVVVHELCHIKQMNHSKAFYQEIEKVFPTYQESNKWLKDNGKFLMQRLNK